MTLPPTMKLLYGALSSHGTAVTNGEFVLPCWFIILASMSLASSSNFEFPFALHLYACPMDLGYWYLMKDTQGSELISPSVMIRRCISLTASTSILVDYNLSSVWSPDIMHCFFSRLFCHLRKKNYISLFLYSLGVHLNSSMRKKAICSQYCLTLMKPHLFPMDFIYTEVDTNPELDFI